MDFVTLMSEEKIQKAIRNGEMDNLPGKGKPLELEDMSAVPEDLRTSYTIMKNSGFLPEEMETKKEMVSLENLIDSCSSEEEKETYRKQLTEKELQFQLLMEKRKLKKSGSFPKYQSKINNRLGI